MTYHPTSGTIFRYMGDNEVQPADMCNLLESFLEKEFEHDPQLNERLTQFSQEMDEAGVSLGPALKDRGVKFALLRLFIADEYDRDPTIKGRLDQHLN